MKQKDYLYDLLVHDLMGPSSVIETTANGMLVKEKYGPLPDAQKNALERIARNIKRAKGLLHEILDVSRSEEQLFRAETFDVEPLLKEVFLNVMEVMDQGSAARLRGTGDHAAMRQVLEAAGIDVAITGKYERSPFVHDKRKIQLILENLISNALKYRRKRINVSISGDGDIVILVSDDGMGIPAGHEETVYKRFMQLKNADLCGVQGLGLGLFCVKSLVDTMGGTITLLSREGSGTSFTVKIPPLKSN
jgi:signal transduction histidine kinase